ncbi:MAG: ribonuclease E activity regulator RraA [Proteobacteria bacterium]|nr:ribonuclease E activity regulator RraA [Pseudomonadota bacterium]
MNTTDICDALGTQAFVPPPHFHHFGARRQFSGEAVTVKCFEDSSRVKELITTPGRGKVLVVDAGGSTRCAVWGDQSGQTAAQNGWEGVVIYGAVRDAARNAEIELGLVALRAVPRKSDRQGRGSAGVIADLGGVTCQPGDRVVVDEDGVVIVRAAVWGETDFAAKA